MSRLFTDTLAQLRSGRTHEELTKKLAELSLAVQETGKAGSISLIIRLVPGKSGQVDVEDKVDLKLPTFPRGGTLMFVAPSGALQRTDPRQETLPGIRSVDLETGEIRSAERPETELRSA